MGLCISFHGIWTKLFFLSFFCCFSLKRSHIFLRFIVIRECVCVCVTTWWCRFAGSISVECSPIRQCRMLFTTDINVQCTHSFVYYLDVYSNKISYTIAISIFFFQFHVCVLFQPLIFPLSLSLCVSCSLHWSLAMNQIKNQQVGKYDDASAQCTCCSRCTFKLGVIGFVFFYFAELSQNLYLFHFFFQIIKRARLWFIPTAVLTH